jgi:preprotein translocase subunit YajC
MIDVAYAMTGGRPEAAGDQSAWMTILPMLLIFGVFYLLLIRPQQKKAKEHKEMLDGLKKGDSVMTQGGIYGKIVSVSDDVAIVEVAEKVRLKVARSAIGGTVTTGSGEDKDKDKDKGTS